MYDNGLNQAAPERDRSAPGAHTTRTLWRMLRGAGVMLVVALIVLALALLVLRSSASSAPNAAFTWKMADRFGLDENDRFGNPQPDGLVDQDTSASFVQPVAWTVHFDACQPDVDASGHTYVWTFSDGTTETRSGQCRLSHAFGSLGSWTVQLAVTSGGKTSTTLSTITLRDYVIVSLGDSAASGEGNPDWLRPGRSGRTFKDAMWQAEWNDEQCHRSALSGHAQAALRLERRDPHSSVTFVHLACSGARITRGLLNSYQGIEPTKVNPPGADPFDCDDPALGNVTWGTPTDAACLPPQVKEAARVLGGRQVDAVILTAGINDLQFSSVVKACLLEADCSTQTSSVLKTGVNASGPDRTVADFLAPKLAALPNLYDQLAAEIQRSLPGAPVLVTEYPDPSTDDLGRDCTSSELANLTSWLPAIQAELLELSPGQISATEWKWARENIVQRLRDEITDAADRNHDKGWIAVSGSTAAFNRHGYCARDDWFQTVGESLLYQGDTEGSFHPNRSGHFHAYALPIETELARQLGVTSPALPAVPPEDQYAVAFQQSLSSLLGRLGELDLGTELDKALAALRQGGSTPAGAEVLDHIRQALDDLEKRLPGLVLPDGLRSLDLLLDDIDGNGNPASDGTFGPLTLDMQASVLPHAPADHYELDVALTLKGTLPGVAMRDGALTVDLSKLGPEVTVEMNLPLRLDPDLPSAADVYLAASQTPEVSVSVSEEAMLPQKDPIRGSYGILGVDVYGGTTTPHIDVSGRFSLNLEDADSDGKITTADWSGSSLNDLVDVQCDPSSHARLDLRIATGLAGLTGDVATLTLDDKNLCDGLAAPTFTPLVPGLPDLSTLTAADVVNAVIHLAVSLKSIEERGDLDLPMVKEPLAEAVDLSSRLVTFLRQNGLADADLNQIPLDPAKLAQLGTVQKLAALLDQHGSPALNFRYDRTTRRLLFDLSLSPSGASAPVALPFDATLLERAGLVAVTTSGSVSVDPDYTVKLGVGIDLTPDPEATPTEDLTPLPERILVQTAGERIEVGATVTAKLSLTATIGRLLDVTATIDDGNGGPATLLAKRDPTKPMLSLDLQGGVGGWASLADVFSGNTGRFNVVPGVNAKVPPVAVSVKAEVGSPPVTLGTGIVTVSWADLSKLGGADGPQVSVDTDYSSKLLRLVAEDPRALVGLLLTTLRDGMDELNGLAREHETLARSLPIIGAGYDDMVGTFVTIRDIADRLVTLNQTLTLQGLERAVESELVARFGLTGSQAADLFDLRLDVTQPRPAIVVDLDFCQASTTSTLCHATAQPVEVPFSLQTPANSIVGVGTSGSTRLDYLAKGTLSFGIELPRIIAGDSTNPAPTIAGGEAPPSAFVLGSSGLRLDVSADVAAHASAHVGPIEVSLGLPGHTSAVAKAAATYTIGTGGPATERLTPAQWGQKVLQRLTSASMSIGPAPPNPGVDCGITGRPGPHHGCAKLPVYVEDAGGNLQSGGKKWKWLGDITFTSTDLLDVTATDFDGHQQVAQNLLNQKLRFSTLIEGLRWFISQLTASLDGRTINAKLPLIGSDLSVGSDTLGDLDAALAEVEHVVATVENATTAGAVETNLESFLAEHLGPDGLGLLLDANDSGSVDENDVNVTIGCGSGPCATNASPLSFKDVRLDLPLGRTTTGAPTFDIGFDGLRLAADQPLTAGVGWRVNLSVGVDRQGFYLWTGGQELSLKATVSLPPVMQGELAFLPTTITDRRPQQPEIDVKLALDVKRGDASGKLRFHELAELNLSDPNDVAFTVHGCALADYGLKVSVPGDVGLPSITANLMTKVDLGGCPGTANSDPRDIRQGLAPSATVELTDVRMDLGQALSNFLRPAVNDIKRYTGPLQPVIDELDKPIPVVSDLAEMVGQPKTTWYDAWAASQQFQGNDITLLTTLKNLAAFVNAIPLDGTGTGVQIEIVDKVAINVSQAVKPPTTAADAWKLISGNPQFKNVLDQIEQKTGFDIQLESDKVEGSQGKARFEFPIWENPGSIVGLLFGQDVDLVLFDAGPLKASTGFNVAYGLPFAKVGVQGSASVAGHLEVSYDTYGIRRMFAEGLRLGSLGNLVHGLALRDLDSTGADVPEIRLDADLHVYANVGIPLVSVEARGGVEGWANINLHDDDGDGKIRYEDVKRNITRPHCLFDTDGSIQAYARVIVSGGPFSGTKELVNPYQLLAIPNVQQWCAAQAQQQDTAEPPVWIDTESVSFGSQPAGTTSRSRYVRIVNERATPVTVTTANVSSSSTFTATGCHGSTIAPHTSCRIALTFTPSGPGSFSDSLVIKHSASNSTQLVLLNGVSPQPSLDVSATGIEFGAQRLVDYSSTEPQPYATRQLTLTNTGGGTLTLHTISALGGPVVPDGTGSFGISRSGTSCGAVLPAGKSCTVEVWFAPQTLGRHQGTLDIYSNAPGGKRTLTLGGTGATPSGAITSSVDFGSVDVDNSTTKPVTLTNDGSVPLTINDFQVTSNWVEFKVAGHNCPTKPATLAPGASCQINVRFAPYPSYQSQHTGVLKATSDATDAPHQTTLTGRGPSPVQITPADPDFGSVPVNSSSTITVTFTNNINDQLSLAPLQIDQPAGPFHVTGGTCRHLEQPVLNSKGQSCTVEVRFTPTATGQSYAGLLYANGAGVIVLHGVGVVPSPQISLDAPALEFEAADATRMLTIENHGPGTLSTSSIKVTTPEFETDGTTCTTVPAGATCTIDVRFIARSPGSYQGQLVIKSNAAGGPHVVALNGQTPLVAITPTDLAFGELPVGDSDTRTVVITNVAPTDLTLSSLQIQDDPAFEVTDPSACKTVAAGDRCEISIAFHPQDVRSHQAHLGVTTTTGATVGEIHMTGESV
jgi:GDSL-like Lipase/Acylhydrolase family/Abnormal spindle-like microcephaly-assoc'd, ASPM-SPD-2-Hydin/PKD domain